MATPSGQISLSDVNAELGFSPTALITMNDAAVRNLAGVPTGAISMANLQGKSGRAVVSLTIATNTNNYDVYANRGPTYIAGNTDLTVTINPGVSVAGFSTGSYALLVPSSFSPGDTVTIVNNGTIQGAGGNGGAGGQGTPNASGTPGLVGGNAVYVNRPTVITNNGNMWAGGGGGGGGGGGATSGRLPVPTRGGGGGGGQGNLGGNGGVPAGGSPPGTPGTPTTAGGGSAGQSNGGAGGAGGPAGANGVTGNSGTRAAGLPGGLAGFYIVGDAFVTYPATGSRLGRVS